MDRLLPVHGIVSASTAGLLCWYTDVHTECWRRMVACPADADWPSDPDLMTLLLGRLPLDTLAASPVFASVLAHSLLSSRLSDAPFTTSPPYVVCALASARLYGPAARVLLQLACVAPGLRASGVGALALLRQQLRGFVRGDGVMPDAGPDWAFCRMLAHCALRMLDMDTLAAPVVDISSALARA